jgi:hypothetical protein
MQHYCAPDILRGGLDCLCADQMKGVHSLFLDTIYLPLIQMKHHFDRSNVTVTELLDRYGRLRKYFDLCNGVKLNFWLFYFLFRYTFLRVIGVQNYFLV